MSWSYIPTLEARPANMTKRDAERHMTRSYAVHFRIHAIEGKRHPNCIFCKTKERNLNENSNSPNRS